MDKLGRKGNWFQTDPNSKLEKAHQNTVIVTVSWVDIITYAFKAISENKLQPKQSMPIVRLAIIASLTSGQGPNSIEEEKLKIN